MDMIEVQDDGGWETQNLEEEYCNTVTDCVDIKTESPDFGPWYSQPCCVLGGATILIFVLIFVWILMEKQ